MKLYTPKTVAIVAYDELCVFEFGIAVELFALPRPEIANWYETHVCAIEPGPLKATGGVEVVAHKGLDWLITADIIVIPGWRRITDPVPKVLLQALHQVYARGGQIVSFCSGAFVLAQAGLLQGRRATTHWRYEEIFAQQFPEVTLIPNVLYVIEERLATAAGSAAGLDLGLALIRADYGYKIANQVARRLVIPPHREGGQAQFVDRPVREPKSRLSAALEWARAHLSHPIDVSMLADQAGMSRRSFDRQFRASTGLSPKQWLTQERLQLAKELLEVTNSSIEDIGYQCGFGSAMTLRHHFRTELGISPVQYRQRFGMLSP